MPDARPPVDPLELRRRALSRWDDEGGEPASAPHLPHSEIPEMTNAELVQLRVRVIALENLIINILAHGSDQQIQGGRDMASYISPRPGATHHLLTIQAAHHMTDLADRAVHFRTVQPVQSS